MLVTQTIENNVNIMATPPTAQKLCAILDRMSFDYYLCDDVIDSFMIPCFLLLLDGNVLTEDNPEIDQWECFLTRFSATRDKCPQCRHYRNCLEMNAGEDIDIGPDYNVPVILLNAEKKQRTVDGLITIIPPMPTEDDFSPELEQWLISTCLAWHRKAQKWRGDVDKWISLSELKNYRKPTKYAEIAETKWQPRKIELKLPKPELE
ncbi:MAG TPA: hypothetical protein P5294_07155 [Smithellaceae bacterium]|nr:hypothetical protein [Smithellaceae bacterium]HRS89245.1 hypothetical protein [Smithellaceae bacterium]HRV26297.1 hypothetical protein [Smithellaceae bacterium]